MASEETYTKDQLEEMNRLNLRRICKNHGMSSEECAQMDFDDLVQWILDQQGGGGNSKGGKKAAKDDSKKSAKKSPPPKGGPRGKDKLRSRGKGKDTTPEKEDKPSTEKDKPGLIGDMILQRLEALEEKIDTIGTAMDDNFSELNDSVNELRADVYTINRRQRHMGDWLEAEEILTGDNAPEGLGFQELDAEIEAEVSGQEGNEGGDE
jgi:hypothetical protein